MKNVIITGIMAAAILMAGCGKQKGSSGGSAPPAKAQADTSSVAQPALTAWQQGDKPAAIRHFLEADWSAGPLFAADSTLSLSEDQFKALSDADRQAKSKEMTAQLDSFGQMAAAVAQAGRDAAAKGDAAQARKYFESLKQCGAALDSSNCLTLARFVGQALKKMSDKEMSKIGK